MGRRKIATIAEVRLWGTTIAAVSLEDDRNVAGFQYAPQFAQSGIEISPITMPLSKQVYTFPELPLNSFHGLPGLLADSLPDRFGNALIDVWLARQGRAPSEFNAIERLCYTGSRGMGAIEFAPTLGPDTNQSAQVHVDALVELASQVLNERSDMQTSLTDDDSLADILRVGTSAGGARAKAIIAWNPKTNEVRSGQVNAGEEFEYWLLKFDGVAGNRDKELTDPQGYGTIEFAYSIMAKAAGITMSDCRIFAEGERRHFMTRRFDRQPDGGKLHMQSLCGLAHFDFNAAGAYSYEQALLTIRQLGLPIEAVEEQFRRMAFNIIARNQDDHTKNIAFLMDRTGHWSLAPAFDLAYSYNPTGQWTSQHQMSMNGKRDAFSIDDFRQCARSISMKRGRAEVIVDQVTTAVKRWAEFADQAEVDQQHQKKISQNLRLDILDDAP